MYCGLFMDIHFIANDPFKPNITTTATVKKLHNASRHLCNIVFFH